MGQTSVREDRKAPMKVNDAFREDLGRSVLCWLATIGPEGAPNVSPKEIFALFDEETLVVADIASPNTVRNIQANPRVCVSFIDIFRQKGFKVEGEAAILPRGTPGFETFGRPLLAMAGSDFPVRNVIRIGIARVSRIWAPSYNLFPERAEEERMRSAYAAYGVEPRP